jgi:Uma2 family endonuclease
MTVAPAVAEAHAAGLPPLRLPPELQLTPEPFAMVCDANPEAVLELAADGRLITMTPTGGETSRRNSRLLTRLQN